MSEKVKLAIVSMSVETRKTIAQEHAKRHGGVYRPALFVEEASATIHPAHRWFEWDDAKAGHSWRVQRARQFVSGIRIVSEVVLNEHNPVTIMSSPVPEPVGKPFMVSNHAGEYVAEQSTLYAGRLTNEAHAALCLWLGRYGAVLREAGEDEVVKRVVRAAEALAKKTVAAA